MVVIEDHSNLSKSARDLCWVSDWRIWVRAGTSRDQASPQRQQTGWEYFKSHMCDQKCTEFDCLIHCSLQSAQYSAWLLPDPRSIREWFDSAQFRACGHIVPVCMSLQYSIGEHAHYSLINIPEAWRNYRYIYIYIYIYTEVEISACMCN